MARKPTTAKAADPLDILATGIAADHKVKMAQDAAKPATVDTPPPFAEDTPPVGEIVDNDPLGIGQDDEAAREQVRVEAERPTKLETPAAPGDDSESVFDRRLARLTTLVIESDFETGTAFGDLRDCVLDLFKHRPKLWDAMIPSEKADTIRHVEGVAREIIRKVVLVVAQDDSDTIQGTLDKKWTVNGETLEMKVKIDSIDNETLIDTLKLAGHPVVLVSADSKRFMSTRRNIDPGSDQVAMTFVSDTPKPAETKPEQPPALPEVSDDALADGDDNESGVDKAKDAAEPWNSGTIKGGELPEGAGNEPELDPDHDDDDTPKSFGVFDESDGEWLSVLVDNGDDEWSSDSADAYALTESDASVRAHEYGDGFVAKRLDADD